MRRLFLILVVASLAACSSVRTEMRNVDETAAPFEWELGDAAEAGFDPAKLEALDASLESDRSSCTAIVRDGTLVHEAYWNGGAEDRSLAVFSVTKSFTSLLLGIAADEGDLDLDDRVSEYVPEWAGTPSEAVTIRQLMSNTSGREWSFETDYEQMAFRENDKTEFAIGLDQEAPPGSTWRYNNSAIQVLSAVILAATGRDAATYAREKLIEPLGMADTRWGADRSGHATTYAGVTSSCRDLARFGQLLLDEGEWQGRRIVSSEFLADATGRSSSTLNAAYGLLFWVNRSGQVLGPLTATGAKDEAPFTGSLAPDLSPDAFWALGFGNQIVSVLPDDGIVAVRIGARPADPSALAPDRFTGSVVGSLRKQS